MNEEEKKNYVVIKSNGYVTSQANVAIVSLCDGLFENLITMNDIVMSGPAPAIAMPFTDVWFLKLPEDDSMFRDLEGETHMFFTAKREDLDDFLEMYEVKLNGSSQVVVRGNGCWSGSNVDPTCVYFSSYEVPFPEPSIVQMDDAVLDLIDDISLN